MRKKTTKKANAARDTFINLCLRLYLKQMLGIKS
jgi:hypothetical protein